MEEHNTILDNLEAKAGMYEEAFSSCAQGTLLALQEQFGLGDVHTLRAATAMPGIALRGETCGAVIGALMALGLAMGREKPGQDDEAFNTYVAADRLCAEFRKEFGGCNCRDVQQHLFGRAYDLQNMEEVAEFSASGAGKKCAIPAGKAARIAGKLILENR